jgi:hypothetical protein
VKVKESYHIKSQVALENLGKSVNLKKAVATEVYLHKREVFPCL